MLEDFLAQLQKLFRSRRLIIADEVLKERLRIGTFRTLDEFRRDKEAREAVQAQEERELFVWQNRLQSHLENARKEFELREPCPKQTYYGSGDAASREEEAEQMFHRLKDRIRRQRVSATGRLLDDGGGS